MRKFEHFPEPRSQLATFLQSLHISPAIELLLNFSINYVAFGTFNSLFATKRN
jgi:hypothetical protein